LSDLQVSLNAAIPTLPNPIQQHSLLRVQRARYGDFINPLRCNYLITDVSPFLKGAALWLSTPMEQACQIVPGDNRARCFVASPAASAAGEWMDLKSVGYEKRVS